MIEVGHYQIMASIVIITDGAKEKENAGNSLKVLLFREFAEVNRSPERKEE